MPPQISPRRSRLAHGPLRRILLLAAPAAWMASGLPGAAAAGLRPGETLPYFRLPWLDGTQAPGSAELFAEADLTALVVWSRHCPRCAGLALQCDRLADSLRAAGGLVRGLVFGPDDPSALLDRLRAEGIRTPHLWDASGLIARDLGLGDTHLGIFLVDRSGAILASLGDEIAELASAVMGAWRARGARAASLATAGTARTAASAPAAPALPSTATAAEPPPRPRAPRLALEGRLRISGADGARPGDTGISGEALESGALVLARWELRGYAEVAPGVELVPRLRISNEDEAALREGAEPWANRYGTASVRFRRGRLHAVAGAFDERIAPLVLQRWDPEDAPPPAGSSGCACGSAGVAGLSQRSLEIPGAEYTFEGLSAGWSGGWLRVRVSGSVPRWEILSASLEPEVARSESRFRRVLSAAALDLGPAGGADPATGLGAPLGVRLARIVIQDDRRTVDPRRAILPGREQDESAWSAWLSWRPASGARLEVERAWWTREEIFRDSMNEAGRKERTEARALRAGGAYERPLGRLRLSGRLHGIRTDPGFEPAFRALTYSPDREGWRAALGAEWGDAPSGRARLAGEAFHRAVREAQDDPGRRALPGRGRVRERLTGLSLRARPAPPLLAEADLVFSTFDWPMPMLADQRKASATLILRWQEWTAVEPWLRCDWIRYREGFGRAHSATQVSLWLRARP